MIVFLFFSFVLGGCGAGKTETNVEKIGEIKLMEEERL